MLDDLIHYLRMSGCVPASVERLRPDLSRWVARLRRRGVTYVPSLTHATGSAIDDVRAHNEINLLVRQASLNRGDRSVEHALRNLSRVRPYKV